MLSLKSIELTTQTGRSRYKDDDATITQKDESKSLKLKIATLDLITQEWKEWT